MADLPEGTFVPDASVSSFREPRVTVRGPYEGPKSGSTYPSFDVNGVIHGYKLTLSKLTNIWNSKTIKRRLRYIRCMVLYTFFDETVTVIINDKSLLVTQ